MVSECPGRQPYQGPSGQEPLTEFTRPRGITTDLQGVSTPGHRSVHYQGKQENPEVLLARYRESGAFTTDAFSISGEGLIAYAFPPLPLIQSDPGEREDGMSSNPRSTLLAQPAVVRLLVDLLMGPPRLLPIRQDIVL